MSGELGAELLRELACDALLVTAPANVRYLSGFSTPKDGRVLVTREGSWLITDSRYQVQADQESRLPVILDREWLPLVAERVGPGRLTVEADHLTVAEFGRLGALLGREPDAQADILVRRRMVKTDEEIARLERAARLTDEAWAHILEFLRPGVREVEVALELERYMRLAGAEGKSFDIVVASGPRSAMPHGVASERVMAAGELVTMDFGALVEGYHADMTRTVALGDPGEEARRAYRAVNDALDAALAAIRPGRPGAEIDGIARRVLADRGLADFFAHSLGHGVGLAIHERPTLSQRSVDVLEPGMVVTVEPGVYLPGSFGVRIEELALVTEDGCRLLSSSPRDYLELPA